MMLKKRYIRVYSPIHYDAASFIVICIVSILITIANLMSNESIIYNLLSVCTLYKYTYLNVNISLRK